MPNILHRIGVEGATRSQVFRAFSTLEGIAGWWTKHVSGNPGPGGALSFGFPTAGPVFEVVSLAPDEAVRWRCTAGPEDWLGTELRVRLEEADGETAVLFQHWGWREESPFMHHCSSQWAYFLIGLKAWLETGRQRSFGAGFQPISRWSPRPTAPSAGTLVRSLYAALMAKGDAQAATELLAEDFIDHDLPGRPGDGRREDLIAAVQAVRQALPDVVPTVHEVVSEGDLAAVRVVASGTHTGVPFMDVPATGRRMAWREVHIFRSRDGRIAEHWGAFDLLGVLRQLGGAPATGDRS